MSTVLRSALVGQEPGDRGVGADGGPLGEADEEFEKQLLELGALIESTVDKHRGRMRGDALVRMVGAGDEAVALACGLIRRAVTSIDLVLASETENVPSVLAALAETLERRQGTVSVRLLCTPATVDWSFVRTHALERRRAAVRITRMPLLSAVIADGGEALVCAESAVGRRASVIRAAGITRSLLTLFDGVWRNSVDVAGHVGFGDRIRTETARRILQQLYAGATDEVSARELSMSVRTYRRYVAEIMAVMGASSRFQAGVRAAELGLLPNISHRNEP
ncbi:LuxR family transcriptional regulator [Streptomyces cinnamoneus]|uniref:LuxR family transcriptional regulator n=1 Tax=Streptomyces cinnamoneus TaxID=53446 RepID=UPI0033FFE51A